MKTLINILHFGIIGAGIGSVITTISMSALGNQTASIKEFAFWTLASMIMGIATKIMFTDKIKLPVATILHFIICFSIVVITNIACGYIDSISTVFKLIVPMFIAIYILVYAVMFITAKLNEKAVNKSLDSK
ncbi:MAG: DUF3021 domain-containing protein [Eubacterium sp.]|nr:DUF3021 domain-containing protein [Eubacterium sp.]